MNEPALNADKGTAISETASGNDRCVKSKTDKSWNNLADAAECILQVSKSTNDRLAHCDVSSKDSSSNCLPVHLNGLVHNHIDHQSEDVNSECNSDITLNTSDLLSGDTEETHACASICDSQSTQKLNDQEDSVSDKDAELSHMSSLSLQEPSQDIIEGIRYVVYESELQMPGIMRLITKDLSEPYSIYTYRYFIHNWPKLCFLAMDGEKCVGAIVCKLDLHKKVIRRGYIAMLAVDQAYRRKRIGSHLVLKAIRAMTDDECDEVVLETEITNKGALRLYENLGFVRDKRLFRYYLNGVDALRLKLWLS